MYVWFVLSPVVAWHKRAEPKIDPQLSVFQACKHRVSVRGLWIDFAAQKCEGGSGVVSFFLWEVLEKLG